MDLPETHIVLVSDQPVPSLLPLLDSGLAAKRAVLVATPAREQHACHLAHALREAGLQVEPIALLRHPYDFPRLHRTLRQLIDQYTDRGVAVNISGGNKLMSIAAYEVCKEKQQCVYYINIETDSVQWIVPEGLPDHPLQAQLRMENYLHACGVHVVSLSREELPSGWLRVAKQLINEQKFRSYIYHLLRGHGSIPEYLHSAAARNYFPQLRKAEIVTGDFGAQSVVDQKSRSFLDGLWLEGLVFHLLSEWQRSGKIQDVVRNLKVRWQPDEHSEEIANEFDVAFLAKNTLTLIECKSGSVKSKPEEMRKVIFQLGRSRQKMGGLRGKAALLALHSLTENLRSRCLDNSVISMQSTSMAELQSHLQLLTEKSAP